MAVAAARSKSRSKPKPKSAAAAKPVEYNILLTATLCLLAFGAVMVYSASSARGALQANDAGTGFLVRYLIYGAIGLVGLTFIARRGLDGLAKITAPLLAVSFALLVAVKLPGFGVSVNGAQRWIGA